MAMIVEQRNVTVAPFWRVIVSIEPKLPGTLQVSQFKGDTEVHRAYYTERKAATKAATDWITQKWVDACNTQSSLGVSA